MNQPPKPHQETQERLEIYVQYLKNAIDDASQTIAKLKIKNEELERKLATLRRQKI